MYATDYPYVACNFLSWMDGAAYAQWAGLRPKTELEYEKACRGPAAPVANEYAWGTASIFSTGGSANYANLGAFNESVSQGNAIYPGSNPGGPARVGIFAVDGATRVTAGATYWGIMEMSGNVWERSVSVGLATGLQFMGTHGDGVLLSAGHATLSDWPGWSGGSWGHFTGHTVASARGLATHAAAGRDSNYGWRGLCPLLNAF